jgi:ribonuclease PH
MQRGRLTVERGMVCYATPSLRSATEVAADRREMSMSQFIRFAILEQLGRDGVELMKNEVPHRR